MTIDTNITIVWKQCISARIIFNNIFRVHVEMWKIKDDNLEFVEKTDFPEIKNDATIAPI